MSTSRGAGEAREIDVDAKAGATTTAVKIDITVTTGSVVPLAVRTPKLVITTVNELHVTAATVTIVAAIPVSATASVPRGITSIHERAHHPAISSTVSPVRVAIIASGIIVAAVTPQNIIARVIHSASAIP